MEKVMEILFWFVFAETKAGKPWLEFAANLAK